MIFILILFFAFVAALVCGAAVLVFVLAIYVFRPRRLRDLVALLDGSGVQRHLPNNAAIGLVLAAALPAVAGVAHAVSGTRWLTDIFGMAGTYFWAWVAISFAVGFV